MTVLGRWRITAMPDYTPDYPDMMGPAHVVFGANGSGAFAFGCVTGQIFAGGEGTTVQFHWTGNDEMDDAQGDGWAELQPDRSLVGAICFHGGDEANFIARRDSSSTAC